MSSINEIKAGEAYVNISVKNSELVAGIKKAAEEIKEFADKIEPLEKIKLSLDGKAIRTTEDKLADFLNRYEKKVKAATEKIANALKENISSLLHHGAALVAIAAPFTAMGDKWDKMSGRTGMSTEWLSQTAHAAGLCGSSIDQVEASIKGMQLMMMQAGRGSSEVVDALSRVGLSYEQLRSMNPEEQFETIRTALGGMPDPSERAALAMKLFGEAGRSLLPMGVAALRKIGFVILFFFIIHLVIEGVGICVGHFFTVIVIELFFPTFVFVIFI